MPIYRSRGFVAPSHSRSHAEPLRSLVATIPSDIDQLSLSLSLVVDLVS